MSNWTVLGINDEVTTCECCGRMDLKKTVVLTDGETEVVCDLQEMEARLFAASADLLAACIETVKVYDSLAWHREKMAAARGVTVAADPPFIAMCRTAVARVKGTSCPDQ